jgi:hypothetical protein
MKRIVSMIAALLCLSAAAAFASTAAGSLYTSAAGGDIKAGTTAGSEKQIAKLSTGVTAKIFFDNTSYAASTKHANGSKEFGSSAGDTRIYSKEVTTQDDLTTSDSTNFNTWTSL